MTREKVFYDHLYQPNLFDKEGTKIRSFMFIMKRVFVFSVVWLLLCLLQMNILHTVGYINRNRFTTKILTDGVIKK